MTQVTPVLSRSPADRHSYLVPPDVLPMLAERGIPRSLDGWAAEPKLGHDSSTNALIRRYRKLRTNS